MNRFSLDETSLSILKDIFDRSLVDGRFVTAEDYRVAKNNLRPLIDKLERRRFILREGQGQTEYRVSLLALVALHSNDANIELGRCADIFRVLQEHYRNPQTRLKQKFFSELSTELNLTDAQVRNAVLYLRDSGGWLAGGSNELGPPDQAWIRPNEHVLDYESFDDLLQEIVQNNIPKVIEPVGVTDPDAQSRRALALLERVKAGERIFQPTGQSPAEIQSFQDVARDLDWLSRQGYFQSYKPLRESQSGARRTVAVHVGDLSHEGVLYLQHLKAGPSASPSAASQSSSDSGGFVFISWSGPVSHQIAIALREWLPIVLPDIEPWVSSEDIAKGTRWSPEVAAALEKASFGIVCLVPDNWREPWVIFEAGAISKQTKARLSPFLYHMTPGDLGRSPLAQFQCTTYDKDEVRKLVQSLNQVNAAHRISTERLDRTFEMCWPGLKEKLDAIKH